MLKFDLELDDRERAALAATDPGDWFTKMVFANAESPTHPEAAKLDANNELKRELLEDWIADVAPGNNVLDLFAANGGFSFLAAQGGASEVLGMELSPGRVEAATTVAHILAAHDALPCKVDFQVGNVYGTDRRFQEPFNVTLNLGGLYHIADPPFVLDQFRLVTRDWMIFQTSAVLPGKNNFARFVVRQDATDRGLASVRGGRGTWHFSVECLRNFLRHAGFEVVDERQPKRSDRKRFPWYCALARPV